VTSSLKLTYSLILYLVYFPQHLKYQRIFPLISSPRPAYAAAAFPDLDSSDDDDVPNTLHESVHGHTRPVRARIATTPEWRQAVTVAVIVFLHV
jgi:hypothetical protein